ncbi:MAG: hypothetical protein Ct9H90mP21_2580 [Methanobacteriota archaeon]|nr:MAG: hypothetical protein Ct9H90mP21_2580 [Euryarchaeota archaeon]
MIQTAMGEFSFYPTEKSKRQALSSIDLRGAIDRTLPHTMDSLISSLVADLRLPE